jgi:hypothetical protein
MIPPPLSLEEEFLKHASSIRGVSLKGGTSLLRQGPYPEAKSSSSIVKAMAILIAAGSVAEEAQTAVPNAEVHIRKLGRQSEGNVKLVLAPLAVGF